MTASPIQGLPREAAAERRLLALVTDDRFGESEIERSVFEAAGVELRVAHCASSNEVASAGREADALLVNLAPVDAAALEALERCRVISRYGVGLDNIDLETARRLGIVVRNVPDYCNREVAEHALGLILSLARGIPARDRSIRAGSWNAVAAGKRVAGSILGILGFGGTARALLRAALGLGFREILVWSPHITAERIAIELRGADRALGVAVRPSGLPELLAAADWLSIHLPLKPETRGLIGAKALKSMKRDAVLINISRGAIVDEEALVNALRSGGLGGAGLDVFSAEPLPLGSPLRGLPNLVLTDHTAYASRESIAELRARTAKNALEVLLSP